MNLRFYLDPATGHPHIWSHGVDEEEAAQVLENAGEDRPGRDGTRVAIGQTSSGRYLRVVYVRDLKQDSMFVITATRSAASRCWRIVGGRGKSIDETKSLSIRLE